MGPAEPRTDRKSAHSRGKNIEDGAWLHGSHPVWAGIDFGRKSAALCLSALACEMGILIVPSDRLALMVKWVKLKVYACRINHVSHGLCGLSGWGEKVSGIF